MMNVHLINLLSTLGHWRQETEQLEVRPSLGCLRSRRSTALGFPILGHEVVSEASPPLFAGLHWKINHSSHF